MKTSHLRLDFVVRALPLVLPDFVYMGSDIEEDNTSNAKIAERGSITQRIACLRGDMHHHTPSQRYRIALPQLGERPTCEECLMLWDAAQEAGLA